MAIDDAIEALKKQIELEDSPTSPVLKTMLDVLHSLPKIWPVGIALGAVEQHIENQNRERMQVMIETCMDVLQGHTREIEEMKRRLTPLEFSLRTDSALRLLLDGTRKASVTRSIERVKRIGTIVANGVIEAPPINEDDVEEMMRVATELGERDIECLRELVRIQGELVKRGGRIDRHNTHASWERGFWGSNPNGEIDSVFNKLESYGLVSRIAPPNNLNIFADIQNRFMLLPKGLRFTTLIERKALSDARS